MYIVTCFNFEDMTGTLHQEKDGVILSLHTDQTHMTMILSYSQLKTLADGCHAFLAKINVIDYATSEHNDLKGTLHLDFPLAQNEQTAPQHGLQSLSQPA